MPLAQIGKAIWQNQWTEELPCHAEDDVLKDVVKFKNAFLPTFEQLLCNQIFVKVDLAYIHFSEQIPYNHSTDVFSPPPNV